MTWRRFIVLLRGLSPQSATVTAVNSRIQFGDRREEVNYVEDPKLIDSTFRTLFGPPVPVA